MARTSDRYISVQSIPEDQWEKVVRFLKAHPMMSKSKFGAKAFEHYIAQADKYGIDANWNIQLPEDQGNDTNKT